MEYGTWLSRSAVPIAHLDQVCGEVAPEFGISMYTPGIVEKLGIINQRGLSRKVRMDYLCLNCAAYPVITTLAHLRLRQN